MRACKQLERAHRKKAKDSVLSLQPRQRALETEGSCSRHVVAASEQSTVRQWSGRKADDGNEQAEAGC